jgi:hypothetical protein
MLRVVVGGVLVAVKDCVEEVGGVVDDEVGGVVDDEVGGVVDDDDCGGEGEANVLVIVNSSNLFPVRS